MGSKHIQNNRLQILGKLTASLIHEIRNPLSVIKLNLDYLNMIRENLPNEVLDCVQSCNDATKRMLFLIENFSDFSKKPTQDTEVCSIKEVTDMAVNVMQINASRLNITLNTQIDDQLPSVYFQKDKLLQVFLNLISNAIEAKGQSNSINIKSYCLDNEKCKGIIWEIEDHGIGIKEEQKKKIFSDFYTSKAKGTGLGLSVCKALLQEYNAEIDFESTYGKGTKFRIKFNTNN
ncbi:MAG: HAMP domain-containing histidine kinase [Ignavibacteriaceae bacterium]|nr:HAMP domain-containing histidine kinase [Ignavibacteriaceae bacterium]